MYRCSKISVFMLVFLAFASKDAKSESKFPMLLKQTETLCAYFEPDTSSPRASVGKEALDELNSKTEIYNECVTNLERLNSLYMNFELYGLITENKKRVIGTKLIKVSVDATSQSLLNSISLIDLSTKNISNPDYLKRSSLLKMSFKRITVIISELFNSGVEM